MKLFCTVSMIIFSCCSTACATDSGKILDIIAKENIENISNWSYKDQLYLLTVDNCFKYVDDSKISIRKLSFYKEHRAGYTKIYEYDAGMDHLVGMFPIGDDNNAYISIWVSGSAYRVIVFSLENGHVGKSIELGTHNYPEFVDTDNDGINEILISEGSFLMSNNIISQHPQKTYIYKLYDDTFKLIKTVPWETRLK